MSFRLDTQGIWAHEDLTWERCQDLITDLPSHGRSLRRPDRQSRCPSSCAGMICWFQPLENFGHTIANPSVGLSSRGGRYNPGRQPSALRAVALFYPRKQDLAVR